MVIVTTLYLILVYLIFGKFKLLPFNKFWQAVVAVIGITIINIFLSGLGTLTPPSEQAVVTGTVTEIAPLVSGEIIDVPVEHGDEVEPGDVLFRIDPTAYQYRVDQLTAALVETEAAVAQLKESYDAARYQSASLQTQLELTSLRIRQQTELVRAGAGSQFELESYEAEADSLRSQLDASKTAENQALLQLTASVGDTQSSVAQVLAQLESAQFDLENTTVVAPAAGVVAAVSLRPGMVVGAARAVMTFVYTEDLFIGAIFPQKALEFTRPGDLVKVSFPGLPGRLFETRVLEIPSAVGEGQFFASGQLPRIQDQRMTRSFPIFLELPEDFPPQMRRLGVAAGARIYTEGAGVVGIVATILQWIQTSLDYVI